MSRILLISHGIGNCKSLKAISKLPETRELKLSAFMTQVEIRTKVEKLLAERPQLLVFNVEFRRENAEYQPERLLGSLAVASEVAIAMRLDSQLALRNDIFRDETIRRLVRFVILDDPKRYRRLHRTFPNVRPQHFFDLRQMDEKAAPLRASLDEVLREAA